MTPLEELEKASKKFNDLISPIKDEIVKLNNRLNQMKLDLSVWTEKDRNDWIFGYSYIPTKARGRIWGLVVRNAGEVNFTLLLDAIPEAILAGYKQLDNIVLLLMENAKEMSESIQQARSTVLELLGEEKEEE